ncbi:MAG: T9SS type A sorting domain-containing protein [Bacteroidales bacterium]
MKKLLLIFALFFFSAVSFLHAQVIEDFESIPLNLMLGGADDASTMTVVPNPDPSGINTSARVVKFERDKDGVPWGGFWSSLPMPVDVTVNKYVHVKVWKPRISPIKFKLEGGAAGTLEVESMNAQTEVYAWEDMVFDFSSKTGEYPVIAFMPDFEDPLTLTEDIVIYFDDIIVNNDPTPGSPGDYTIENFEHIPINLMLGDPGSDLSTMTVVLNPDPSGINTSATVMEFLRDKDGVPWGGFWSPLPEPVDVTENKYVHVKVWKPRISPLKFKLEGGAAGNLEIESMNPQTEINKWVDIVFDFSSLTGEYPVIAFMPDFQDPLALTDDIIIYFDDIRVTDSPIPMSVADVTMNVNMSYWTFMDKFDPAEDFVDVAGNFNGWDGANHHLTTVDDSIYSITLNDLVVGTLLEFKFRINGSWNDSTAEFPAGGANRTYTVVEGVNVYDAWYNDEAMGISENLLSGKIQMFPNPSVGDLIISTEADLSMIVISTLQGQQVASYDQISIGNTNISISDLSNGLYFVTFYGKSGEKLTQKLIKK